MGNDIFQSLNHADMNLKLGFLIKSGYHIVPGLSAPLPKIFNLIMNVLSYVKRKVNILLIIQLITNGLKFQLASSIVIG